MALVGISVVVDVIRDFTILGLDPGLEEVGTVTV